MKTFLKYCVFVFYLLISIYTIYHVMTGNDITGYKKVLLKYAKKYIEEQNRIVKNEKRVAESRDFFNDKFKIVSPDKQLQNEKEKVELPKHDTNAEKKKIEPPKQDLKIEKELPKQDTGTEKEKIQFTKSGTDLEKTTILENIKDKTDTLNKEDNKIQKIRGFKNLDLRRNNYHDYTPPFKCSTLHWRDIIVSCNNNIKWELKSDNKSEHTSVQKSKFLLNAKPSKIKSYIKIITYYSNGKKKFIGGDFWWMNVIGPSSFHVDLKDNNDGTYESYFSFVEPGNYTVTVELIWSLCDGLRNPPSWWFKSGDDQGKYQKRGSLGVDTYIGQKKSFLFTILQGKNQDDIYARDISGPNQCQPINSHCGYWRNDQEFVTSGRQIKPEIPKNKKLPSRSTIYFHGDSLQFRLHDFFLSRPICKELYHCNLTYTWVYPNPPSKHIYDDKDFNKTIILESIRKVLLHPDVLEKSSVVLINFGLHLMMDISFDEAVDVLEDFVRLVQSLKTKHSANFPRIVWKSTTAPFERERYKYNEDHRRFLTKQRSIMWNAYSREVLCNANIPILDVYYMAASYIPGTLDGVHYVGHVFESAAAAFESFVLNSL
ncbi:uncharacterized protein LOC130648295 [Hydractinia symbiolongicarpus]|uniref:uncharacterized protein LOC130648295 n=1 Tax=Hydractinia symbiolongicarpus TaxID=13093 RepID=UPI00254D6D4E|nr:uncharacterized protein LOC130648295 [Hydractinia symbiolongicarpus]